MLESKGNRAATGKTLPLQRGGSEFRPIDWQRIQKVFRVCSSQERFFVRLGRNRTSAVEWVRITLLTHSTNDGQN